MMAHVDPTTLKITREISREDILLSVAHPGDASRVFVGSSDARIYELDITAEKPEPQVMEGHQSYVSGLVQTGTQLISGSFDGTLIWWDLETREQIRVVDAHQKWIRQMAISPDGSLVAYVSLEGDLHRLFIRRIDGSGDRLLLPDGAVARPVW